MVKGGVRKDSVIEKKVRSATMKGKKAQEIVEEEHEEDDEESENEEDESLEDDENESGSEGDEDDDEESEEEEEDGTSEESDDEFEDQGSSSDDDSGNEEVVDSDESDIEMEHQMRSTEKGGVRQWTGVGVNRQKEIDGATNDGSLSKMQFMNADDLSSDDEEGGNTIGRVPLHWYDGFDHIGYDVTGNKIGKREEGREDRLDLVINQRDNPDSNRTVYDMYNDRQIVLSDRDLEIIRRVQGGTYAHAEFVDTPKYVDHVSSIKEDMPLYSTSEPKRRFVTSKWEMMRVTKIVKAMKEGKYKTLAQLEDEIKQSKNKGPHQVWNDKEDDVLSDSRRHKYHLPAPKMPLPGHAESYNPPPEYIMTDEEKNEQEELDPSDRKYNFTPEQFSCLRHVPGYENFIKERFERCLDLYLCPRKMKRRLNIDPESLVPEVPKPSELKPFPNSLCLQYLGHKNAVRDISVSPDGQYLASASDDCTVRLWEVDTCLCVQTWHFKESVSAVCWNPSPAHHILAAIVGTKVVFITTGTGDADSTELTDSLIATAIATSNEMKGRDSGSMFRWEVPVMSSTAITWKGSAVGVRLELNINEKIKYIRWHHKGDYIVALVDRQGVAEVSIHQLSKAKSQTPFSKSPGNVQAVCFHNSRPYLFVATQQHVKIYHLVEQKLVKKLISGCKWLSSIDIHPSGDHIILGSYDKRMIWFDLDLSTSPFKTLKYHEKAIRDVQYHKRYPLMASGSDDGNVHVFHGAVYSDLNREPLVVPLKILKGHGVVGGLGVLSVEFHPKQPWIFTSGADGVINLFQDIN